MTEAAKKSLAAWLRKWADSLDPLEPNSGGGPRPTK